MPTREASARTGALELTETPMTARASDMPARPLAPRTSWIVAGALLAAAAAWVVFSRMPPMPVRVGRYVTDATVPIGYQLSVFPAFGGFLAALAVDVARGRDRRSWLPRALLVALTGTLSIARLTGALPLSGHALFLLAALAYELTPPTGRDAQVSLALVIPALLVVGWCKLVVWGDPLWFGASALLGCAIGVALARTARS